MKKQQIFAYACSAALLGTLIGCGQKTEIDQSVPDTIIEVAKTTASSETTSVTSETSAITSSSTAAEPFFSVRFFHAESSVLRWYLPLHAHD